MVFHLFERVIDPNNFKIDFNAGVKRLVAEGFNIEEAKQINWLRSQNYSGRIYGTLLGLFVAATQQGYLDRIAKLYIPRLHYQPWFRTTTNALIVLFFYKLGDYVYTSRRFGADYKISNHIHPLIGNRTYIDSREAFVRNFEPLNRKFTREEVESFLKNDKNGRPRKWIYNPHIYDED